MTNDSITHKNMAMSWESHRVKKSAKEENINVFIYIKVKKYPNQTILVSKCINKMTLKKNKAEEMINANEVQISDYL